MSDSFKFSFVGQVLWVRFTSPPKLSEVFEAIEHIANMEPVPSQRLWEFERGVNLSSSELRQIAEVGKEKLLGPQRVALLGSEALAFGLMRMYEVFRQEELLNMEVFKDRESALEWLNAPDAAKAS